VGGDQHRLEGQSAEGEAVAATAAAVAPSSEAGPGQQQNPEEDPTESESLDHPVD